ncbi:hypothetical protein NC651_028780 [Populus alba x Populus x berolinensis]|nr:hypothetical protein NC651_028780 [Populus alba x Populus x berolinensis]
MARLWRRGKQKVSFALKRALKKRAMVSRDRSKSLHSLTKKNLLFLSSFYFVALRATTTSFLTANI